jgi:hypothetical protein
MNPFTIGQRVKPEGFIGRTALIRTAFTQIAKGASHLCNKYKCLKNK